MIKKIVILNLVCLLHSLCKGQTYFNNYYSIDYINLASTNIFMEPVDSSFTFFSFTKNVPGGRQDFTASRISKNGALLQNQNHNINNYDYGAFLNGYRQFISATKTSYLASTSVAGVGTTTVVLNKISKTTLDTLITKYYNDLIYYYSLNNYIKFNDNKYYLIGNRSDILGNQNPMIFQLDSNLNIVSTIAINTGSLNYTCNNAVYNPITKKILFGSYKNFSNLYVNLCFLETDTLGVITNSVIINNTTFQSIGQLKYSAFDNSYVFCGGVRTSKVGNTNNYRLQVTKLNSSSLNTIWSKTYGTACLLNNLNTLIVNNDGSMVSCGRYADSAYASVNNYDAAGVILKVNAVGDSIWMRQYNNYQSPPNPSNYFETLFGIEKTYDGGYIACGGIMNQPQGKAWILKTDSLGCVSAGCGGIINGTLTTGLNDLKFKDYDINVYPNPANEILTIEFTALSQAETKYKIEIINIIGQTIKEEELKFAKQRIDISSLQNGIYFLQLFDRNKLIGTTKIIKQ